MRHLSITLVLAFSVAPVGVRVARCRELQAPAPMSKKSAALCRELAKARDAYMKSPVASNAKAFQGAITKCLWEAPEKSAAEQAVVIAADVGNYYAREGLAGFQARFERAFAGERTQLRRATLKQVKLALLDIDAEYRFELGEGKVITRVRRKPAEAVRYLRGRFWLDYAEVEVASSVVRKTALIRHSDANEALQAFLKQAERDGKSGVPTYSKGEFKELVARAIVLNALVRKHRSLAGALGEALCSKDTKLVGWALEEGRRLKPEAFSKALLEALKHHRGAYELKHETCHKAAERLLVNAARKRYIKLPEDGAK